MANGIFNVAKGRFIEFHERVNNNDPTNAALIMVLLKAVVADGTLEDFDTLSALLGDAGNTEADATNYARKTITDADISASTVDDTNNRRWADMPNQTWVTLGGASNNTISKAVLCYDPDTTGGTDANLIPIAYYDINGGSNYTTTGVDFTLTVSADGYARSS